MGMSFAEVADMSHEIRETRDALDAAGNTDTSTAIGKVIFFFSLLCSVKSHYLRFSQCFELHSCIFFKELNNKIK